MTSLFVNPSFVSGTLTIPASKSHTLRAILFALMAHGQSKIENALDSPDTEAMLSAIQMLGAKVHKDSGAIIIEGVGARLHSASDIIDVGNSGITLRFIAAVCALTGSYHIITGDASIRHNRPASALIKGLEQMGAIAVSLKEDGRAPLIIKGPIQPSVVYTQGSDSQPISALLIAMSFLDGVSELIVENPGEKPWIDMTLYWLKKLGINVTHSNYNHYHITGRASYNGFCYKVPGDFSTAAFPIVAALIHKKALSVKGLCQNDVQGDKQLLDIVSAMGADVLWDNDTLLIHPSTSLKGLEVDINGCIDALPILTVLACFCKGPTRLYNARVARSKESDRLFAITNELRKMGAIIDEAESSLTIYPSTLKSATLHSHSDHRIAMSLAVAASACEGKSCIEAVECINKTYKQFVSDMKAIGADMELIS